MIFAIIQLLIIVKTLPNGLKKLTVLLAIVKRGRVVINVLKKKNIIFARYWSLIQMVKSSKMQNIKIIVKNA